MSDTHQQSSSADRRSADATNLGDKLNQRYERESMKKKPPTTAPKPKRNVRQFLADEQSVLKNLDDVLDREEDYITSEMKDVRGDSCADVCQSNLMDCFAGVTITDTHVASRRSDCNIAEEEDPVVENVDCAKVVENPVHIYSATSDHQPASQGDDRMQTVCSVAEGILAPLAETGVKSDCSGREV